MVQFSIIFDRVKLDDIMAWNLQMAAVSSLASHSQTKKIARAKKTTKQANEEAEKCSHSLRRLLSLSLALVLCMFPFCAYVCACCWLAFVASSASSPTAMLLFQVMMSALF